MWLSSVFTSIHDLSLVTADCLLTYAVTGTEYCFVLFACCCTLLLCFLSFALLSVLEVLDTLSAETHALWYILGNRTSHIVDQPGVCGCTAGFSTHAARWSRQPASGLWHMLVVVPCENELLHGSAKVLADLIITIACILHGSVIQSLPYTCT